MPDNVTFQTTVTATPPNATVVSTEEVTTLNGVAVTAQQLQRIIMALRVSDGVGADLPGDTANGLDVDVTRMPALTGTVTANLGTIGGAATSAKQDTEIASLASIVTQTDGIEASLVSILAKILTAPATEAKQDTEIASLASILAKIIAAPATEAKQDTGNTSLSTLVTQTDGVEASLTSILAKIIAAPATEAKQDTGNTSLASILAKIIAAPATEAKQDTGNTSLASLVTQTDGIEASLTSILAKIIAAPATEAKQDTGNTSLASILSKIIAAPATEAKQDTGNTSLATLVTQTDGIESSLASIDAGTPAALGPAAMANSMPVVIASDQTAIPVIGSGTTVDATLTRPADTTTYAANDEMTDTGGAIRTFTGCARVSGGSGYITDVIVAVSSNVLIKPQLVLFLYDTTSTPAADNAAFAPADGVQDTCVAVIPINIWYPGDDTAGAGGNAIGVYGGPPISFKTAGSANLFGRTKMLNAYVPTSGETYKVRVKVQYAS